VEQFSGSTSVKKNAEVECCASVMVIFHLFNQNPIETFLAQKLTVSVHLDLLASCMQEFPTLSYPYKASKGK
jgi:hypothetical protein